jgi:hypothetical protein
MKGLRMIRLAESQAMSLLPAPISVQFTLSQREWLDQKTRGGSLSRSSVIRLIVAEAMERDQDSTQQRPAGHGAH